MNVGHSKMICRTKEEREGWREGKKRTLRGVSSQQIDECRMIAVGFDKRSYFKSDFWMNAERRIDLMTYNPRSLKFGGRRHFVST